jgi:hypothetical protein
VENQRHHSNIYLLLSALCSMLSALWKTKEKTKEKTRKQKFFCIYICKIVLILYKKNSNSFLFFVTHIWINKKYKKG